MEKLVKCRQYLERSMVLLDDSTHNCFDRDSSLCVYHLSTSRVFRKLDCNEEDVFK